MSETISVFGIFIFGIIFSIIGFLINRTFIKKIDDIEKAMSNGFNKIDDKFSIFEKEFREFKEESIRDFVRKVELRPNETAHIEMWKEINSLRERVAVAESK
jgi:hypothetical protein